MTSTRRRVVGTAGHIDHGKTTLVRALTGVDTDRLPEEKRRGITIDLGFASWTSGEWQIAFIDVPGHERFVKNMLAGVGGIDSALLVIAADESIMPQTREHFAIAKLLRIPTGVVAITKSDLVDPDIVEIVRLEAEELVRGSFLEGKPVVPVSGTTGAGLAELKEALLASVAEAADRDTTRRVFRLPIDRVFTMKGFGAVVTGTAISGSLQSESEVEILPDGIRSRARRVEVHGGKREAVEAGERVSINLADVTVEQLRRGQQITAPGTLRLSQVLTVSLELLPDAAPLKDQTRVRFHHFSAELLGSVRLLGGGELAPGSTANAQIRLESPVTAVSGDRFVIRRYSPALTIGGGTILDPHLGKLTRGTREEIFDTLASAPLAGRVELYAKLAGLRGFTERELQQRTGLTRRAIAEEVAPSGERLVVLRQSGGRRWIHVDRIRDLRRDAMDLLAGYFRKNRLAVGLPKGELVQKLFPPDVDAETIEFLLGDLQREGIVTVTGDMSDVPGRSRSLSGTEGDLARTIEQRFLDGGLKPPPVSELINTIQQKPKVIEGIVSYLVKTEVLTRLAEGIYLHRTVLEEAKKKLEPHHGELVDVGWFKDFYGISRKIVIPLLEHFDRAGVTKRLGDQRRIL
jgi:selenocysteine-specific elongation factor